MKKELTSKSADEIPLTPKGSKDIFLLELDKNELYLLWCALERFDLKDFEDEHGVPVEEHMKNITEKIRRIYES